MQNNRYKTGHHGLASEVWVVTDCPILDWALAQVAERCCGQCVRRLSSTDALTEALRQRPRVALVSFDLVAMNGREAGLLAGSGLVSRSLVIGASLSGRFGPEPAVWSALGTISLAAPIAEIERRIRAAWFNNTVSLAPPHSESASPLDILTSKEHRLFELIARGATLQLAANKLAISYKTAESRRTRIYRKLKIRSARDAVRIAIRTGLVSA